MLHKTLHKRKQKARSVYHLGIFVRGILLSVFAFQDSFPVLIQLDRCDDYVTGVDAYRGSRAVGLVPVYTVDVDDPLFAINLSNFAISSFIFSPNDHDFVILSYW